MAANPYGPVTTTDTTHLTDDDWDLSLPPIKYKRYPGTDKLKSLFQELRNHHRNVTVAITAICIMILTAMVVILVIGHNPMKQLIDKTEGQSTNQYLDFYPVPEDKTTLISYTPYDFSKATPNPIRQSLDSVLVNYRTANQLNEIAFADCNSTYKPMDKTCRVSRNLFGDTCTLERNYGYQGNQPCVFIQLNLPTGVTIKPIAQDSPLWEAGQEAVQDLTDTSYVPVTCDGTAAGDRDVLMSVKGYGPNSERIMYYPKQGLQAYIYRERDTSLPFLKPGVMVEFTSLVSRHIVHVTCTAWGQLYDTNDRMIDHKLLSTHFALLANPK